MRMRTSASLLAVTAAGGALLIGLTPVAANAASANLIKNPGAEAGAGGTGGVVKVPNWKTTNGDFTAVKYGAPGFPTKTGPGPASRGKNFFGGGPTVEPFGSSVATQTVSLASFAGKIDGRQGNVNVSGFFGGEAGQTDNSGMEIIFRDGHGNQTADSSIGFKSVAKTGLFKVAALRRCCPRAPGRRSSSSSATAAQVPKISASSTTSA